MEEIVIKKTERYKTLARKMVKNLVQIVEMYWDGKRWTPYGMKTISRKEYEAIKKLFEEEGDERNRNKI